MSVELPAPDLKRSASVATRLLDWFESEGRKDLPWQSNPTPYRVWVSEIMLQQTQVATALPYYRAFMARFPDLPALASAELDEVLHLWSGLGYYARARNLHRAARIIQQSAGGEFPDDIDSLISLPGLGRSTAAAVLALSQGQRHPIRDGNVKRVLARHFGVEGYPAKSAVEKRLWSLADACTPQQNVAAYTQAIMDLGATVCTRARPVCLLCPLSRSCVARAHNLQDRLPTPKPKSARPTREAWVLIAMRGPGKVLLEHRPPAGIWGGLWALPEFPTKAHAAQWCDEHLSGAGELRRGDVLSHAFSHFDYELRSLTGRCLGKAAGLRDDDRYCWYDIRAPAQIGIPKPVATLLSGAMGTGQSVSSRRANRSK